MGVSISPRLPYDPLFVGGAGRAKGLGGPVAPALIKEVALGEGGGRTTPEECVSVLVLAGVAPVVPESLGDDSAVWLPFSECSLGICNIRRGREPSFAMLFVRDTGTGGTDDADCVRWGWFGTCVAEGSGGELPFTWGRDALTTSMDCERSPGSVLIIGASLLGGSALLVPHCANID